ncbi:MAG: hypothetical protein A2096_00940 [Spirochaetes bacterium GWF1_41_5]|nr:MAG: hypothetical protein A2096_00940 [Spirochaetes bacterium GWF1_41_5]HBE04143.1 hypothetical protein [Spirochaetia bacterium]
MIKDPVFRLYNVLDYHELLAMIGQEVALINGKYYQKNKFHSLGIGGYYNEWHGFQYHNYDFFELFILIEGAAQLVTATETRKLEQGDIFFLKSDQKINIQPGRQRCRRVSIVFTPDIYNILPKSADGSILVKCVPFLEPFIRCDARYQNILHVDAIALKRILLPCFQIIHYFNCAKPRKELVLLFLTSLLQILQEEYLVSVPALQREYDIFRDIFDFIEDHLDHDIKISDLAGKLQITGNYLSAKFKKTFKISLINYITTRRIVKAKILLKNTDFPITHISHSIGFNDSAYFAKTFKNMAGITPRAYRDGNFEL